MAKPTRRPVCRRYDLCIVACPQNRSLEQRAEIECPAVVDEELNDDEVLEIVFDIQLSGDQARPKS